MIRIPAGGASRKQGYERKLREKPQEKLQRSLRKNLRDSLLEALLANPFSMGRFADFAALFPCDPNMTVSADRCTMEDIATLYPDTIESCSYVSRFHLVCGKKVVFLSVSLKKAKFSGYSGMIQRVFLARLLSIVHCDAAIAAFFCKDDPGWMLSFVRPAVLSDEQREWFCFPPAARSSFPAGSGRVFPHALSQLSGLFGGDCGKLSLEAVEEAFSQTALARRFLAECRKNPPSGILAPELTERLGRYGFSTWESQACDRVVAIDGAVLGTLYENLQSSRDRKRSGTFYTPPEIVRHMCVECLANYLAVRTGAPAEDLRLFLQHGDSMIDYRTENAAEVSHVSLEAEQKDIPGEFHGRSSVKLPDSIFNKLIEMDKALAEVKILDPAAGSGAFPICMLHEIADARLVIAVLTDKRHHGRNVPQKDTMPGGFKSDAIRNSIYAADIDENAISITKFRLWLSLASEYGYCGNEPDHSTRKCVPLPVIPELPPFPGLDCNVVCGDSLLGRIEWAKPVSGFDIVLGNPPYISAVEGSRNGKEDREAIKARFPLLKGAFDTYAAFLLDGIDKLKCDGTFSWIIPNKLLVSGYAKPVLDHLKKNGLQKTVSISGIDAFLGAGVYPVIISGYRGGKSYGEYCANTLEELACGNIRPRSAPREYGTFADFGIGVSSGATGFQARQLSGLLSERPVDGGIPFIVSGSVDPFHVNFRNVRYMGKTYERAYMSSGKGITRKKWDFWCGGKIVVAGMTRDIEAFYSEGPLALGVGIYAIHRFADFDPWFLTGLLNSEFISWYVNSKFWEKHLAGGYLAINKSTLEQLPLVPAGVSVQAKVAELAKRIQKWKGLIYSAGSSRIDENTTFPEPVQIKKSIVSSMVQLNELVNGIYGLNGLEIREIREFFQKRR